MGSTILALGIITPLPHRIATRVCLHWIWNQVAVFLLTGSFLNEKLGRIRICVSKLHWNWQSVRQERSELYSLCCTAHCFRFVLFSFPDTIVNRDFEILGPRNPREICWPTRAIYQRYTYNSWHLPLSVHHWQLATNAIYQLSTFDSRSAKVLILLVQI